MRYVIFGGGGMLGRDLRRALDGRDVAAPGRDDVDLTDAESVRKIVTGADVVINAAAYTRVDDAETHEAEATRINGTAAGSMAGLAAAEGARFVQLSTDYVFDGSATTPYPADAPLAPISAYGRSKAEGERLVTRVHPDAHIVRTAWLYGADGPNFPRTMLKLAGDRETVSVVTDQVGQPTWTLDLAHAIVALLDADVPGGTFHVTNAGQASKFDLARATFELAGLDPDRVLPTDSAAFPSPAPRPAYAVLSDATWRAAGLPALRPWRDALADAVASGVLSPR